MKIETLDDLLAALRQSGLLEEQQLEEVRALVAGFGHPAALTRELEARGWLTSYQASELLAGRGGDLVLGQYVILSLLGQGGMGKVFKARHRLMKRIVALKVINPALLLDERAVQRFHREIEAVASLSHPNIVTAFDADCVGSTHFLVMEYVPGINLSQLVKDRGPLPPGVACEFARQAALGLQHAHEQGMVHRDIKPHNLLATRGPAPALTPIVKILDMGLARLSVADVEGMTNTGAVMGTPDYIAPEQASDSHSVDIRADLYSLGCTLYFLLTGEPPFPGGTAMEKVINHKFTAPRPVDMRRPGVPPAIAAVVARLLAKGPQERYQTPAELAAALGPLSVVDPSVLPAPDEQADSEPDIEGLVRTIRRGRQRGSTLAGEIGEGTRVEQKPQPVGRPSHDGWSAEAPSLVSRGGRAAVAEEKKVVPKPVPRRRGTVVLMAAGLLVGVLFVAGVEAYQLFWPKPGPAVTGVTEPEDTSSPPPPTNRDTGPGPAIPTHGDTGHDKPTHKGEEKKKEPNGTPKTPPPTLSPEGIVFTLEAGDPDVAAFSAAADAVAVSNTGTSIFEGNLNAKTLRGHLEYVDETYPVPEQTRATTALAIGNTGDRILYGIRSARDGPPAKTYLGMWQRGGGKDPLWRPPARDMLDIACLALSKDLKVVIAGTSNLAGDTSRDRPDPTVLVWDLHDPKNPKVSAQHFDGHKKRGLSKVTLSADGKHAASYAPGDTVRCWDVANADPRWEFSGKADYVKALAIAPAGDRVFFADDDDVMHNIAYESVKDDHTFQITGGSTLTGSSVTALAVSSDGSKLVVGTKYGAVRLYRTADGTLLRPWEKAHTKTVLAVAISPDGKYVYSAASDGAIKRWHTPAAEQASAPK